MYRLDDRKSGFKKGIDASEGRRCRNETSIKLRKDKREEGLAKRRAALAPTGLAAPIEGSSVGKNLYTVADIPQLAAALLQPNIDGAKLLDVIRGFRKILSVENNPPVQDVLRSGVLPALVHMLTLNDKPDVQFEAAWALTNIASTDMTQVVVDAGAVPIFVNLLSSPSADIRDQSAWCLGNIAGDSPQLRDVVLFAGAMQPLLKNIESPATPALLNNSVWALSNFCRGKPSPVLSHIASAIPVLGSILRHANADTKVDALWALSYISDGNDEPIQAVVDCDLAPLLVELLGSEGSNIVTPALRTVGNIVSGNDEHTQAVLDAGLINRMPTLLQSPKRGIRKEACWVLSNIAAGTQAQIAQVFKGGMIHVVNLAMDAEWEVRKEAIWVLSNIATGGTSTQVMSVVECGAIDALCSILKINDTKMLLVALDAINNILKVGSEHGKDYISFIDECDGVMEIENLQEHESEEVYQHAIKIIETYFTVDDNMEDENLAPVVDGNTFSFGAPQKLGTSFDDTPSGAIYNFAAF